MWENIQEGKEHNFDKRSEDEVLRGLEFLCFRKQRARGEDKNNFSSDTDAFHQGGLVLNRSSRKSFFNTLPKQQEIKNIRT